MNAFALSGLCVAIACTIMAGLVHFSNRKNRVNRLWALFCLTVSVWGFASLLIGRTHEPEVALVWWRVANVATVFIPSLFYHFVTVFAQLRRPKSLAIVYAFSVLFLISDATPLLITTTRHVFGEFHYNSPGPLYGPLSAFFWIVIVGSHLELLRYFRRIPHEAKRILVRYFLIGTIIGFAGGATTFLPVFGIDLYPYGNFAIALFPVIMTYAFLRYRLMDLNQAVIRGVTFLVLYVIVVIVPFVVGDAFKPLWRSSLGEWWWVAPVVLMGILASSSPVLFLLLTRRLEQRLWRSQRRYHRTLLAASSGMVRIKDLNKLCRLIVYVVSRTVGLSNSAIFLYDSKQECYRLVASRYEHALPKDLTVSLTDPLIDVIRSEKGLLILSELQAALSGKQTGERTAKLAATYAWMCKFEARLIVPSLTEDRLLAFLVLGPKRNGETYTADDVAIFSGLANQATLGIENALFFEEIKTSEAYMIQSEKLASLGQLASGMAHEIHNPLTIISGEAQLYLERFRGKDLEVDALLQSIIEECHRAADITRRILRFAKPAPSDLTPVDLRATIEETITLAGYQVRLDRVQRHVEVDQNLPKVRGNQNQLQEVLLNLVLNACQAMGPQGGKLEVMAKPVDGEVEIQVRDTGPGIPHSKLTKVFDPFYTTKANGTGLGLFVSQRIVRAHNGTIEVESTEGQGTVFTIRLPAMTPDQK